MPTPKTAASKGYSSGGLNPGPPPWAKSGSKSKTILSGAGAPAPSVASKLQSKAKAIASQGGSLGSIGGFQIKPTTKPQAKSAIGKAQSSPVFGGKRGKF